MLLPKVLQPDIIPLQDALSVRAWFIKLQSGSNTIWFDYAMSGISDAITISDDEYWNTMVNQGTFEYRDMATVMMVQWPVASPLFHLGPVYWKMAIIPRRYKAWREN